MQQKEPKQGFKGAVKPYVVKVGSRSGVCLAFIDFVRGLRRMLRSTVIADDYGCIKWCWHAKLQFQELQISTSCNT